LSEEQRRCALADKDFRWAAELTDYVLAIDDETPRRYFLTS
jgi:hypothetical protein